MSRNPKSELRIPKPALRRSCDCAMRLAAGLLLLSSFIPHPSAFAVKTERWEIHTPQEFMRGKLNRLSVASDGELRLGYSATRLGDYAKEIWCSTVGRDGSLWFGTGSPADVYLVSKEGQASKVFETEAIAVTALATDLQGNVYAATLAEGKIFKVTADKKQGAEFCRLRAPYIWALAVDKNGFVFAGTGPDGKIYRISPDGKAEEWYTAEESNILTLALDADGTLLAGGSDRGLLYRVTDKSKGVVLYQFAEDEVKSLAVHGKDVFVAVNRQKVKRATAPGARRPSAAEFEELTQRLTSQYGTRAVVETGERGGDTPPEARMGNLLSGAVYLRNADGRFDKWANWDNESVMAMAADAEGGVLVAMAGAGRVYRVPDSQHWDLLFDLEERQALTLAVREGRLAFIGTGNIGSAYAVDSQKAAEGDYTSEVRDCKFLTTWGNLLWTGEGAVSVSTRTGNTSLPDATWSDWSAPLKESPGKVASPAARFIQVRTQLGRQSDPRLQSLSLYYQTQNQKPVIASVDVGEPSKAQPEKPKTPPAATDEKPESSSTTDVESSVESALQDPADRKVDELRPRPASPVKQIRWSASDKDGDSLVYRLYFQAEGDSVWVPVALDKPLKKTEYSWNTESIPDGWYRVKVAASDEESNPAGESLADEKASDRVKVDNTRPDVLELACDSEKKILTGVAKDNLSRIRFLEYSVDGGDWKYFAPKDGVFDDRQESFAVELPSLTAGEHYIAVRATDEEGNVGVGKAAVKPSR